MDSRDGHVYHGVCVCCALHARLVVLQELGGARTALWMESAVGGAPPAATLSVLVGLAGPLHDTGLVEEESEVRSRKFVVYVLVQVRVRERQWR